MINRLNRASDIAVYCHTNPDGDALGSMLALTLALERTGKQVSAYCDSPVPDKYKSLKGSDRVQTPVKRAHELAVSVDCSSLDRLGLCSKSFLSAHSRMAIDHHASFERFADICLVDGGASACAELIFALLKQMKLIDADIAALLFGAIVTDSGCFSFSNTTKRTHEIAGELLSYGFDMNDVIYRVYRSSAKKKFDLKTRVLSKARFFEDDKIALILFSQADFDATNTNGEHTEGIVSELIDIDSVQVAYALSEVGVRHYKLSVRTKSPIDADEIARTFGGGGHKSAAGCRINGYYEDIVDKLVKLARDRI